MEEFKDLTSEIDAIVQNSGKSKIVSKTSRLVEISVNKEASTQDIIIGKFAIITRKEYLDGAFDNNVLKEYSFQVKGGEFLIENYDNLIARDILKSVRDITVGIWLMSNGKPMSASISNAFICQKKEIIIICDSGKNAGTKEIVDEMLFTGNAHYTIDMDSWTDRDKSRKWAILELERRVANGECVAVTGVFKDWYELMPIVVISSMYGHNIVMGRTAGQKLSIGSVIDINVALENFLTNKSMLSQFYKDPYSSIEYFKNIDNTINSLVIFPPILFNFFKR